MMFTRQSKSIDAGGTRSMAQEDFFLSYLKDNVWQKAVNAGYCLNTPENGGAETFSSDGTYMVFYCLRPSGGPDWVQIQRADVNLSGLINILDLSYTASKYLLTPTASPADPIWEVDINNSGGPINILDLAVQTRFYNQAVC